MAEVVRTGGSHAQRELWEDMLIVACLRDQQPEKARKLIDSTIASPAIGARPAMAVDAVTGPSYNPAMRIIGLAGWSGSGKTTLITKVLPRLIARGYRVSTLKHAHHGFDLDQPGKDSSCTAPPARPRW